MAPSTAAVGPAARRRRDAAARRALTSAAVTEILAWYREPLFWLFPVGSLVAEHGRVRAVRGAAHVDRVGRPGVGAVVPAAEPSAARAAARRRRRSRCVARQQRLPRRRDDRLVAAAAADGRARGTAAALVGDRRAARLLRLPRRLPLLLVPPHACTAAGSTSTCTAGITASSRRGRSPGTTCTRSSTR